MRAKINDRWELNLPDDRADFHTRIPNWEKERMDSMYKNIVKGDVVIDIGTEVGDMAALFTLWGAKVVCIEPQPKYWPIIKQHFDMNDIQPFYCFAGFASTVSEPTPPLADFEIGNDGIYPKCANEPVEEWAGFRNVIETGISTPQMKLDDLITLGNIPAAVDVITIDVEGAEFEVLKGASGILTELKPIVYVSIHPTMLGHDWNVTKEDVIDYMTGLGYSSKHLFTDHEEHWVFWNPETTELAE